MNARDLILIFSVLINYCHCDHDELNAVVVIFRHGDRTPVRPYPKDPYRNASYWPVDFGQLTNIGKMQQFELGKWLRNRYQNFLPNDYSEKDIYVQSTDVDRTLMSAEANLAGLYPPANRQIWDEDLKWQPIPIHTIPETLDNVLAAKKICPKYDLLYKSLFKTPFFTNISHKNHDLYAYLSSNTGAPITNLETLEYLFNTLFIETVYNLTLPDWAVKVYPKKLEPWAFLSFATQTFTRDLARLKTGLFFNNIINYFKNKTHSNSVAPKFLMFSAHDVTISNVLNSMGAFEYHCPPYAATIIFELRRRLNGVNYIRIFYKNTSEATPVTVHNCNSDCDFDDFITILKPLTLTPAQWEKECQLRVYGWPFISFLTLISMLLVIGLILMGIYIGEKTGRIKESNKKYMKLLTEEIE